MFVSVAEGLDPTTPAGKMMMRLMLVMAEFELDRMRETWDESRRQAVDRGIHLAGRIPIGYLAIRRGHAGADHDLAERDRHLLSDASRTAPLGGDGRIRPRRAEKDGPAIRPGPPLPLAADEEPGLRRRGPLGRLPLPGAHQPIVERGIFELVQLTRSHRPAIGSGRPAGRPAALLGLR